MEKTSIRTFKPKENIGIDFNIKESADQNHKIDRQKRHFNKAQEETKPTVQAHGRKHIETPLNESHIVFSSPKESERPKPFEKPRPNTKPEFHTKKFTPSRHIIKPHNVSSISFSGYNSNTTTNSSPIKGITAKIDPASLPAAGTKTGFYGVR